MNVGAFLREETATCDIYWDSATIPVSTAGKIKKSIFILLENSLSFAIHFYIFEHR
jgi:hypothetical protein